MGPLFPVAGPSACPAAVLVLGYVTSLVALTALALLRQPGVPAVRSMWAEDGVIFYAQALSRPLGRSLLTSYNGYDQLVPRVAIELSRSVPVRDAATVVALMGAAGLAALACLVFHMARGHLPSAALRGLLVAAMVLLPIANYELLDNLVNLPWWMFFAAFWALLWRPRGRWGALAAAVFCALAAASEPLVVLLVPLAIVRAIVLRRPREQAASIGLVGGLALQLAVVLGAKGGHPFRATGLASVPSAFAARVGLGWLTGRRGTTAVLGWDRSVAELAGAALFVIVVIAGLRFGSARLRALTVAVAVLAPLCFAVPVWLRGVAPLMNMHAATGFASRYAATPILMVLSVVLALAGHRLSGQPRRQYQPVWAVAAACALVVPGWVTDFRDGNLRMAGPTWSGQLTAATGQCRRWNSNGLASLGVAPPGEYFVVHCRVLGVDEVSQLRFTGNGPRLRRLRVSGRARRTSSYTPRTAVLGLAPVPGPGPASLEGWSPAGTVGPGWGGGPWVHLGGGVRILDLAGPGALVLR